MSQNLQRPGQQQWLRGLQARTMSQEQLDAIWYWFDEQATRIAYLERQLAQKTAAGDVS